MATFSGVYNSFNALKVKTRGNLLDAVCVFFFKQKTAYEITR